MRVALRTALGVFALYILLAAGLALWLSWEFDTMVSALARTSARVIGREVGGLLSGVAIEELMRPGAAARTKLERVVLETSDQSDLIRSLAVLDSGGGVIASDDGTEVGERPTLPPDLLTDSGEPPSRRVRLQLRQGAYDVFVPMLRGDENVGYLRLSIASRRIQDVYGRVRRDFILTAVAGLLFAGIVALAFHLWLSRRGALLAEVIESVARGREPVKPGRVDEFGRAIEVARTIGAELNASREESAQAARRLQALRKVTDVGIFVLGPGKKLEFANAAAKEIFGCDSDGEIELAWESVRPRLEATRDRSPESGVARVDLDLPRGNEVRHLRLEMYQTGEASGDADLVLVKDREQLKALEHELGLAIQMRGLARFHMVFAHDLKAPLNAMVMNLELLSRSLNRARDGELHEQQNRYVAVLRGEIERVERQLEALLAHTTASSRAEERIDLGQLLAELVSLLEPLARQQGVALKSERPDTPVLITGYPDRLKQAMLNIAMNALEVMPGGGALSITLDVEAERARMSFADTGTGIPNELRSKIYRMHFSTKDGGTGIGLYVARSVVDSHGGEIRVDSEPGRGTRFRICLPLAPV